MRTSMTDLPDPSSAAVAALARLTLDKAAGVEMKTVTETIDGAVNVIKNIIETTLTGIHIGIATGEPTAEDLQRLHELRSLLDDLP